uniref:Uncharacterized protein n=1 Tax=Anguilla anguilla TaxID=7936 RepID=A0A0E9QVC3_ANGAN
MHTVKRNADRNNKFQVICHVALRLYCRAHDPIWIQPSVEEAAGKCKGAMHCLIRNV